MRILKTVVFGLLLVCLLAEAKEKPSIAIIDFFPFGYADADGNAAGLFVALAKKISQEMAIEFDIKLLPVPRAIRAVSMAEIDLLISYKDPVMVPNVEFIGNIGCLTSLLVPHASQTISSLEQVNKLRVGFITGGYFDKRFSGKLNIIRNEVPSNEAMLTMLVRGRLDAIVINDVVFNAYIHGLNSRIKLKEGWQDVIGVPFAVETMETHVSIANDSPYQYLKPQLTATINRIFNNDGFQSIYDHYKTGSNIKCGAGAE